MLEPPLKSQSRWCGRVQAAMLAATVAVGAAGYALAWRPVQGRIADLAGRIDADGNALTTGRGEVGALPAERAEVARLAERLRGVRPLPVETDFGAFLAEVALLRESAGLGGFRFTPGAPTKGARFSRQPIELKFRGEYARVHEFLRGLSSLPRLLAVTDLVLRPAAPPATGRPSDDAGRVDATMTVVLYFRDPAG